MEKEKENKQKQNEPLTFEKVFKVKKDRIPSWTDRILFGSRGLSTNFLELANYDCNNLVTLGDHRPVFG
jgi:hypothetical protein